MAKKAELQKKVDELQAALIDKAREAEALQLGVATVIQPKLVPVKNFGGTNVAVSYDLNGRRQTLLMGVSGRSQTGSLPLETWEELEREEDTLIKLGYMARTDKPFTNVNVFPSIPDFLSESSEKQIKDRISKVENVDVLHMILTYIETIPRAERTGKYHGASAAVRVRIGELAGVRVADDDGSAEE